MTGKAKWLLGAAAGVSGLAVALGLACGLGSGGTHREPARGTSTPGSSAASVASSTPLGASEGSPSQATAQSFGRVPPTGSSSGMNIRLYPYRPPVPPGQRQDHSSSSRQPMYQGYDRIIGPQPPPLITPGSRIPNRPVSPLPPGPPPKRR